MDVIYVSLTCIWLAEHAMIMGCVGKVGGMSMVVLYVSYICFKPTLDPFSNYEVFELDLQISSVCVINKIIGLLS